MPTSATSPGQAYAPGGASETARPAVRKIGSAAATSQRRQADDAEADASFEGEPASVKL